MIVGLDDRLPLTCTREGACCHGKAVWLNPWETARLAATLGLNPLEFRRRHTCDGGLRLHMNGADRWRDQPACTLYDPARGCIAHGGRPLACRLYPLGRERQGDTVQYLHEGARLPCLDACPTVMSLPTLSVRDYLASQETAADEAVQDAYLDAVEELAEASLVLLLESELPSAIIREVRHAWKLSGAAIPDARARKIATPWLDRLLAPVVPATDSATFVSAHRAALSTQVQAEFGELDDPAAIRNASTLLMAMALHLGQSLGADPVQLAATFSAAAQPPR